MQIEVEVKGQRIKRINSPGSVEDTLNYLTCHFIFGGEEWDNTVRTAYFENQKSGERYAQIIADDGTCTVPWEALTDEGFVRFSVAGEREDYRITTDVESFYNSGTIYGGNPSEPPTPDQYDQMIALAEQTKEIAESVRRDADEGKFDGDPGEPGKPGAPGRDGVSPTAKVEQTDDGAVITITDATGTTTAELKNGKEGNPGQNATDEQVRGAVDAYMAEHPVQVDTDDLIKIAIKEEASGAVPIVTTDSAEMGVQDIKMQGWTEQDSTTGAQLFNSDSVVDGIISSGTIVESNGFATSDFIPVTSGNVYSRSTTGAAGNFFYDPDKSYLQNVQGTINIEAPEGAAYLRFCVQKTNFDLQSIMFNEGSTLKPWEPYTGGQPSPSPEYPQEIVSAGKYNEETQKWEHEIKLTGKNLIPTYSEYSDWMAADYKYIPVSGFMIGETYTFSQSVVPELGEGVYVALGTVAGTVNTGTVYWIYHSAAQNLCVKSITFVATQETYYLNAAGFGSTNMSRFLSVFPDLMVELGTERTEYEPYKEQTVLITSDRPLTKWDKLEKRNGQWGWVYKSAEIMLDGSENWGVYAAYEGFSVGPIFDTPRTRSEGFSERFICETGGTNLGKYTLLWLGAKNRNIYFVKVPQYNTELSDSGLQDWKDYLAENPLTILTYADEGFFVPLSESEQSALNALTTYYPTTVLDNDQGCEMSVQYIADTKAYIDKKISAIQAAIVNTI